MVAVAKWERDGLWPRYERVRSPPVTPIIERFKMAKEKVIKCYFCGKTTEEVKIYCNSKMKCICGPCIISFVEEVKIKVSE